MFESLEPRLLLSADPLNFAGLTDDPFDLTLRVIDDAGGPIVQLIDNTETNASVLVQRDLADVSEIFISGSEFDDILALELDLSVDASSLVIRFDGQGGADTLVGDEALNLWQLTGVDSGTVNDLVEFENTEYLFGAADNQDTFVLHHGGGLSGLLDGGDAGYDTLEITGGSYETVAFGASGPHSGIVVLDGETIAYDGLEPITVFSGTSDIVIDFNLLGVDSDDVATLTETGGTYTFESTDSVSTFETLLFDAPLDSLTIDMGGGTDSVSIEADVDVTANFTVVAESITIADGFKVTSTGGDISLTASADVDTGLDATITVDGALDASGNISLDASVDITDSQSTLDDFSYSANASVAVGAALTGEVIDIAASVTGVYSVLVQDASLLDDGDTSVTGMHTATATIAGGVAVIADTSLDLAATDDSSVNINYDPSEDSADLIDVTELDLSDASSAIDLTRSATASIGDDVGGIATVAGTGNTDAGVVSVAAGIAGGTTGTIVSDLYGQHITTATDTVSALVTNADIDAAGLSVEADNAASYTATAKVAENSVDGGTSAAITGSEVRTDGSVGVNVVARDAAQLTATSSEFQLDPGALTFPLELGAATAVNDIDRSVSATIDDTASNDSLISVVTGALSVDASSEIQVVAFTDAQILDSGNVQIDPIELTFNGTIATNVIGGDITASIEDSLVETDGGIAVEATNDAIITATARTGSSTGGAVTGNGSSAFAWNAIGIEIENPTAATVGEGFGDVVIGFDQLVVSNGGNTTAYIADSEVSTGGDILVQALSMPAINATVSNAASSTADALFGAAGVASVAVSGSVAANRTNTLARAYIETDQAATAESVFATGGITVNASDDAEIFSNSKLVSSSITSSDGGANLLGLAIAGLEDADYTTDGTTTTDANGIQVTDIVVQFGDKVFLTTDFVAEPDGGGSPGRVYEFVGSNRTLDLADEDFANLDLWKEILETDLIPQGNNFLPSNSLSYGGVLVRNEISTEAEAWLSNIAARTANGDIAVTANITAEINATADTDAESSGGNIFGKGTSTANNGVIATNGILSSATAIIQDSTLDAGVATTANLTVSASNTSTIKATNSTAVSTGSESVGVMLAYNTIGYESQDVLSQGIDALIDAIGQVDPATVTAKIVDSQLDVSGDVEVTATNDAEITARVDTQATSAAAALYGADGINTSFILASNLLATDVEASMDNVTERGTFGNPPVAGGAVTVEATDSAIIDATTSMEPEASETNTLGFSIVDEGISTILQDYQFTTESGTVSMAFGDQVRIGKNVADLDPNDDLEEGDIFRYMGADGTTEVLDTTDYTDFGIWQRVDEFNALGSIGDAVRKLVGLSGGTAKNNFGVIARNDVDARTEAFIDDSTIRAGADISVIATERARITALDESTVTSTSDLSGSGSRGGVITNNQLLSKARAYVTDSTLTTLNADADITVEAFNLSILDAKSLTSVSGAKSIGLVAAFNSFGWNAANIFFNAFDTLLGTEIAIDERPVEAKAFIENSDITATGDVSVTASTTEQLFTLSDDFAQPLDDLSIQDRDDAGEFDAVDAAQDAQFLADLRTAFDAAGYALSEDVVVTLLATASEWLVDDKEGSIYIIRRDGDNLNVSLTSILDVQVGNEVDSNVTNDRIFADFLSSSDPVKRSDKGQITSLKYGANGIAAGGVFASNRASTLVEASIDTGTDFSSSETVGELENGDRVALGDGSVYEYIGDDQRVDGSFTFASSSEPDTISPADTDLGTSADRVKLLEDTAFASAGEIYEYIGNDPITVDFDSITADFDSNSTPDTLERGNTVELLTDIGGGTAGQVLRYTGDTLSNPDFSTQDYTSVDWELVGIDLTAIDYSDTSQWQLTNAPLAIDLSNTTQDYANNDDWELVGTNPAVTIDAGGNVTVGANDAVALIAETQLDISSAVTNNIDSVLNLINQAAIPNGYVYTTESGVQTIEDGDTVRIGPDFGGGTSSLVGRVFEYGGDSDDPLDDLTVDLGTLTEADFLDDSLWTDITDSATTENAAADFFPNLGNLADSNSRAMGGIIVFNDLRADTSASIEQANVNADGGISVSALQNATLLASTDSNVSSSGGSAFGTGDSIAINGIISSNVVLSEAKASIVNSDIDAGANVGVDARNTARMDATTNAQSSTGDTTVAGVFAFNTVGWKAQNVLFNIADAFVSGDPLVAGLFEGTETAMVSATIVDSDVAADGNVAVTAESTAVINATTSNVNESAASALINAGGLAAGAMVSTNKVNSAAEAYIDNSGAAAGETITAGNDVIVSSADNAGVFSNNRMDTQSSTSNDGGAAVLQETLNDLIPADWVAGNDTQTINLRFGDLVRLENDFDRDNDGSPDDEAGGLFVFLGDDQNGVDLSQVDYSDLDFWKPNFFSSIFPQGNNVTNSDSRAIGATVVLNDLRSNVDAYIESAIVNALDGGLAVTANESATVKATVDSSVSSSGGSVFGEGTSLAINGSLATNVLLSDADAYVANSTVTLSVGAGLRDNAATVTAINDSLLDATNLSITNTGDTGVGVQLAFNTIGWEPSNALFQAVDALLGDPLITNVFNREQPAAASAYIDNSTVNAGDVSVVAETSAVINSLTSNQTSSAAAAFVNASGIAIGGVITSNKVSTATEAFVANNAVINAGGDLMVDAKDTASITAENEMIAASETVNSGGLNLLTGFINQLGNEYNFTSNSGVRDIEAGDRVRLASDFSGAGGTAESIYLYLGDDLEGVDLGSNDYTGDDWVRLDVDDIESYIPDELNFNVSSSKSIGIGGIIAFNDVRANVNATISSSTVDATGSVSVIAAENASIVANTVSEAEADGGSVFTSGLSLAIAGAIATNQVFSNANASIDGSTIGAANDAVLDVTVSADNQSSITATVDSALTVFGGGDSVSIGVVLAFNRLGVNSFLLETIDAITDADLFEDNPIGVNASIEDSDVYASGNIDVDATLNAFIDATIENSALATSISLNSNTSITIAPLLAVNRMATDVRGAIQGGNLVRSLTGDISVDVSDASSIDSKTLVSSFSLAAGLDNGTSVAFGVNVALNHLNNDLSAFIADATSVEAVTGNVQVTIDNQAAIDTTAAAIAVALSGSVQGSGIAFSGGGAGALNVVLGDVNAFIANSSVVAGGDVTIGATNAGSIDALIAAAAGSVAFGLGSGVTPAIAIGIAAAENFIGFDALDLDPDDGSVALRESDPVLVQAYIDDASISAGGALGLSAESISEINATIVAASVAVGISKKAGIAAAGGGAGANNRIETLVRAYIDGDGNNGIDADSLSIKADDRSRIDSIAGAAAVAGGLGISAGVGAAVAITIANNEVSNEVEAYIINTDDVDIGDGGVIIDAQTGRDPLFTLSDAFTAERLNNAALDDGDFTSTDEETLLALAAEFESAGAPLADVATVKTEWLYTTESGVIGDEPGEGPLVAGDRVRLADDYAGGGEAGTVYEYTGPNTAGLDLGAQDYSTGPWTQVAAQFDISLLSDLDLSLAEDERRNAWQIVGPDGRTYVIQLDDGDLVVSESAINAIAAAASVAVGVGKFGVGLSGGGVQSTNVILTETNAYVQDATLTTEGDVTIDASSAASINANVLAASLAIGGGKFGVGVSIGAAVANNFIGFDASGNEVLDENGVQGAQIRAFIQDADVDADGIVALSALSEQSINAQVLAGSVGLSVGLGSLAAAGSGVDVQNMIGVAVKSFITGDQATVEGASVTLTAADESTISSLAGAAAVAASLGGLAGAVAVGVTLAENTITTEVESFINDDALVTATDASDTGLGIKLLAREVASIDSTAVAASLSFSLGAGFSLSLAGAGADAKNVILGKTNAYVDDATLVSAGVVDLDALNSASIESLVAGVSVAVSVGAFPLGASIGVGLARNFIGYGIDNDAVTPDLVLSEVTGNVVFATGNLLLVDTGVRAGEIYEFLGGTTVIDLNDEDLSNNARWRLAPESLSRTGTEVQTYIVDSNVTAGDALTANAVTSQYIGADTLAVSAALSVGIFGVGLAGAGASTENRIAVDVRSVIEGGDTDVQAESIALVADDSSAILARTGSAALAGAAGAIGVSASVAVALAYNEISNVVEANITDAGNVETTSGDIIVRAIEDANIDSLTAASSLSGAIGGIAITLNGAGANADNIVNNKVHASIVNSVVDSGGSIEVRAVDTSEIDARVQTAGKSLALGAVSIGVSIGASLAENLIGESGDRAEVRAFIDDADVSAANNLDVTTEATQTITAEVEAFASAVVGGFVSVAGAGAGSRAINKIQTDIDARIDHDSASADLDVGGDVNISASDLNSTIRANVESTTVSEAVGVISAAVSVAVSLSDNEILNAVTAGMFSSDDTVAVNIGGSLNVSASSDSSINSFADAAAGSSGSGFSISASGGGVDVESTINTTTRAQVNQNNLTVGGDLSIAADADHAVDNRGNLQTSASGFLSLSGGGAEATTIVTPTVEAILGQHDADAITVNVPNGNVSVTANSSAQGDAIASGTSSAGLFAGGGQTSVVTVNEDVASYIADNVTLTAGNDVTVSAVSEEDRINFIDFFLDTDIDADADSFAFPIELRDGARVVYTPFGLLPGLNLPDDVIEALLIDGLMAGRTYNVLNDPASGGIRFGSLFDAAEIDPNTDTIVFETTHLFCDGDVVVYENDGTTDIPGLVDGTEYVVQVIDSLTIKLLDGSETDTVDFDESVLVDDTFNITGHGFSTDQPVTYRTAGTFTFRPSIDFIDGVNETILIGEHDFQVGDRIIFRSDDPIANLENGTTYEIFSVGSSANAPPGVTDLISLNTLDDDTQAIDLTPSANPFAALHSIEAIAIDGLVDGQTYYVVPADGDATLNADRFALSTMPGGAILTGLDSSLAIGPQTFATESIDIGAGLGDHSLHIAIGENTPTDTTHQLRGEGGIPLGLLALIEGGDGASVSRVSGSTAADLISGAQLRATINVSPDVDAYIAADLVQAGNDVNVQSSASKIASSIGQTSTDGGLAAFGEIDTVTNFNPDSDAYVGRVVGATIDASNVVIEAGGDFNMSAFADHNNSSSAVASGGGLGSFSEADSTINMSSDTRARIGTDATITVEGHLGIETDSQLAARAVADADGRALGGFFGVVDSDADADINEGSGAPIRSEITILSGANIRADSVSFTSVVSEIDVTTDSDTDAGAIGAFSRADTNIDIDSIARVNLLNGATIRGDAGMDIRAIHADAAGGANGVNIFSDADANCDCGAGDTDANADTDADMITAVNAFAGATLLVGARDPGNTNLQQTADLARMALFVEADSQIEGNDINSDADRSADFIDIGRTNGGDTDKTDNPVLNWNSDVVFLLGGSELVLRVDAGGNVVEQEHIENDEFSSTATNLNLFGLNANEDFTGQALFTGDNDVEINGNSATFFYRNTWESVTIIAEGDQQMSIGDITPYNDGTNPPPDGQEDVRIDVRDDQDFGFAVVQSFEPTLIDIQSLGTGVPTGFDSPIAVMIEGVIDNPIGTTSVTVENGDVASRFFEDPFGTIRTNILKMDVNGNVGPENEFVEGPRRPEVELVNSEDRPTDVDVNATGFVKLDLRGLQREITAEPLVITGSNITAGENIELRLFEGRDQTTMRTDIGEFTISVFETSKVTTPGGLPTGAVDGPDGGRTTEVSDRYRPPSTPINPVDLPLGVFGTGDTEIEVTYDFGLIESGRDIDISGRGGDVPGSLEDPDTAINLIAGTNIIANAGDGTLGNIDVDTNGAITLTESEGDLRVGLVQSTFRDVTLISTEGSIVDAADNDTDLVVSGDAAADAIGRNIILTALNGGVGDEINVFETDINAEPGGALTATADDDIVVTEVAGDLSLDLVRSESNVTLVAADGGIFDFNENGDTNIQGALIDLTAVVGPIGLSGDDVEINLAGLEDLLGDLDNNGVVNTFDLALFRNAFGTTGPTGDLNNDGIVNTFDLALFRNAFGSVAGDAVLGLSAVAPGNIYITEVEEELFVSSVESTGGGDIRLTVRDDSGADNDLILAVDDVPGSVTTEGTIELIAGDDLLLPVGSTVTAPQVVLQVDPALGDADGTGGTAEIFGEINAESLMILGGDDADTFIVDNNGGLRNDGGTIENLPQDVAVEVDGNGGSDQLILDDTGDLSSDAIQATGGNLFGLADNGSSFTYVELETLQINAGTDADTLTIDGTNPHTVDELIFNAGDPITNPGDVLEIIGGSFGNVVYDYTGPTDGSIDLGGGIGLISFTSVEEPILNTGGSNTTTIRLPNTDDTATLQTASIPAGGLEFTGTSFPTTRFATPASGITISGRGGADNLDAENLGSSGFTGTLTINGNTGSDVIEVTPTISYNIVVFGGNPTLPTLPGDTLLVDTFIGNALNNPSELDPTDGEVTLGDLNNITYFSIETLDISSVNDQPINVVPTDQTIDEDTPLTFSTANGNAFLILDGDAGNATNFSVDLEVVNGVLDLTSTTGLTVSGNGGSVVSISGTLSDINAALGTGLVYTPNTGFAGDDTLTITSNDQGNTGESGDTSDPQTDTDVVNIEVVAALSPAAFAPDPAANPAVTETPGRSMIATASLAPANALAVSLNQAPSSFTAAAKSKYLGQTQLFDDETGEFEPYAETSDHARTALGSETKSMNESSEADWILVSGRQSPMFSPERTGLIDWKGASSAGVGAG